MPDPLFIALKTALDPVLRFQSMEGSEALSHLFDYNVIALAAPTDAVVFHDLLGQPAQVTVNFTGKPSRHYHGLVTAASYEGSVGPNRSYKLTLRPWLWLLTRSAQMRIFQRQSVVEILQAVFDAHGGVYETRLNATYRAREYCVQYRESDFDFASRLMEEEGIYYFFVHADGRHTLVLADSPAAPTVMQALASLPFRDSADPDEGVLRWRWSEAIQTTKVTLRDRHFMTPQNTLEKMSEIVRSHANNALEVYDAPAGLAPNDDSASAAGLLPDESQALAKLRVEELQADHALVDGDTNSTNLCSGARFSLTGHAVTAQNAEYVVRSTRTRMQLPGYASGAGAAAEHHCGFTAYASGVAFRPARTTPRPSVAGPQTATVVGPSGDEIHVDQYGRVKLQFHWDREGQSDDTASCYVRVAQPSAGKGWGMVFLPRVGQEVVVDFLEGNPDRPLVTGAVYNADNMPPYVLPDNKTVSAIKSRSSAGGAATDFNELRFEDLAGSEYLLMQSQKDKFEFVKETLKTEIGIDQHHTVKNDLKEKVEGEFHLNVVGDVKHKFGAKRSLKVTGDMLTATDGLHSLKAAQDITTEAGTAYSIKAGTDLHVKSGKNVGIDGGMNIHIKGGMNVVIEGGMQLTLKAGGGSIVIGPDGVAITGPLVKINSGGSAGSGSGASPVAPTAPDAPTDPEAPADPLQHS